MRRFAQSACGPVCLATLRFATRQAASTFKQPCPLAKQSSLGTILLALMLLFACRALHAENIAFSADSMAGRSGKDTITTLCGNAKVMTASIELKADSITMSGEDFRYIDAEGAVTGKNKDSGMEFAADAMRYDRKTHLSVLKGGVSLTDTENAVAVKAQVVEWSEETDIATIQINAVITQKDNICKGAFAIYNKKEQTLSLNGNAEVKRGEDTFHAEVITLDMNTQEMTLDGKVKGSVVDKKGAGSE